MLRIPGRLEVPYWKMQAPKNFSLTKYELGSFSYPLKLSFLRAVRCLHEAPAGLGFLPWDGLERKPADKGDQRRKCWRQSFALKPLVRGCGHGPEVAEAVSETPFLPGT